jgi:hypothetical protein
LPVKIWWTHRNPTEQAQDAEGAVVDVLAARRDVPERTDIRTDCVRDAARRCKRSGEANRREQCPLALGIGEVPLVEAWFHHEMTGS